MPTGRRLETADIGADGLVTPSRPRHAAAGSGGLGEEPCSTSAVSSGLTRSVPRPHIAAVATSRRARETRGFPRTLSVTAIRSRYAIRGVLGRGATSVVHDAVLTEDRGPWRAGSQVALKVLRPEASVRTHVRAMFAAECRAALAVEHPGLPRGLEAGTMRTEDGEVSFLARERIEGRSLEQALEEQGSLAEPLLRDVARQAAAALAALHAGGWIHGDVKPANVMLAHDERVVLIDHGGALDADERATAFTGTLSHAAPELLRGEAASAASDAWSLGVVMFEALTGRLPVPGDSGAAAIEHLLAGERLRLRDIAPTASPLIDRVLEDVLSLEPKRRPPAAWLSSILAEGEGHAWWQEQLRSSTEWINRDAVRALDARSDRPLRGRSTVLVRLVGVAEHLPSRGGAVLVRGAGGCGKSRLLRAAVDEVIARHADACVIAWNAATGLPALARSISSVLLATGDDAGGDSLADELSRATVEPGGVVAGVLELASRRPIVLALDDLHVDDAATAVAVPLAGSAARTGLVLACASRAHGRAQQALEALSTVRIVDVEPLDAQAALELVGDLVAPHRRRDAVAVAVAKASGGNPQHARSALRRLEATGLIGWQRDGRYRIVQEEGATPEELLSQETSRRIDALEPMQRRVLEAAAVAGSDIDVPLLAEVTGRAPLEVLQALDRLERAGFVVGAGAVSRWEHALERAGVVESMTPARRRELDDALGLCLARRLHASADPDREVALALRAGQHLVAARNAGAARAVLLALARPMGGYEDPAQVISLVDDTLTMPELAGDATVAAALAAVRVAKLGHLGRLAEAGAAVDSAVEAASRVGEPWLANAILLRCYLDLRAGNLDRAGTTLEAMAPREHEMEPLSALRMSMTRFQVSFARADTSACHDAFAARRRAIARLGDLRALPQLLLDEGVFHFAFGDRTAARGFLREAVDAARAHGCRIALDGAVNNLGLYAWVEGDMGEAGRCLVEGRQLGLLSGLVENYHRSEAMLSSVRLVEGRLELALALAEAACTDVENRDPEDRLLARASLASVLLARDLPSEALKTCELPESVLAGSWGLSMRVLSGQALLSLGRTDAARAAFEAAAREAVGVDAVVVVVATSYLALLGARRADDVELKRSNVALPTLRVLLNLHLATGDLSPLREAVGIVERMTSHLVDEQLAQARARWPLGREVLACARAAGIALPIRDSG